MPQVYRFRTSFEEAQWVSQKCLEWKKAGQPFTLVIGSKEMPEMLKQALRQKKLIEGQSWSGSILSLPLISSLIHHPTEDIVKKAKQERKRLLPLISKGNFYHQRTYHALNHLLEVLSEKQPLETLWRETWRYGQEKFLISIKNIEEAHSSLEGPLILPHTHMDPENPPSSKTAEAYNNLLQHPTDSMTITWAKMDPMGGELFPLPSVAHFPSKTIELLEKEDLSSTLQDHHFHIQSAEALNKLQNDYSNHSWSVTELEDYLKCPFYYFSRRLLNLKPEILVDENLSPLLLGESIHKILHQFFESSKEDFIKATHDPEKQKELIKKIESLTQAVFDDVHQRFPQILEGLWAQRLSRTSHTLKEFIKEEWRQLKDQHVYHPTHFEWNFGSQDHPPLTLKTSAGKTISIQGRIDRIDVDAENNKFIVIDYKTGTSVTGAAIQKGKSLQIPLYIAAAQQNLPQESMGGLFVNLSTFAKKDGLLRTEAAEIFGLTPRSSTYTADQVWERLFQDLPQRIDEIINKIIKGIFSLKTREDSCPPYCEFQEACRVKERDQQS